MLVVKSLDVDINGTPILRNIGLTIDNGEIIGLIIGATVPEKLHSFAQ